MKTVMREIVALIIVLLAIMLLIVMFFFDYIKSDSNQPQAATYQMTENEADILMEKENYNDSQNKIVLSTGYSITEEELSQYKASGELKTGQSNPFDETPITDVLYDAEGNAYYKVITNRNEVSTGSQWYGTVSGDAKGITTSSGTTVTNNGQTATNNVGQTQSGQTTVPTQQVTAIPTPIPTPVPTSTPTPNQVYNPDTDITAPSTDSGNLSQATGRK